MMNNIDKFNAALSAALIDNKKDKIGLLAEHTLHRTLKFFYSLDEAKHEIKINGMFADVLIDNHIYEIQTHTLSLLRNKLTEFLKEYNVTVVYPAIKTTTIHENINGIETVRKSTSRFHIIRIFKEIMGIRNFFNNNKLSLDVILLNVDEYRVNPIKRKKHRNRKRYSTINQIPNEMLEIYHFNSQEDWKNLIKSYISEFPFTTNDLHNATKQSLNICCAACYALKDMNILKRVGKKGNSYLYELV